VLAVADGRALGTPLRIVCTVPSQLGLAEAAVANVVRQIDATCSRFRDDSEISRLNALAGSETAVSPLLLRALQAALRAAQLSDGAVDPTVGGAVRNAGYTMDFAELPAEGAAVQLIARPVPGWRRVRLFESSRRVLIPKGVELDLGSSAKALASDLAAAAAWAAMGEGGVLVSLGGDIAVAGRPPADGWHVQIADSSELAIRPDAETVRIHHSGIATSSVTVRRWTRGGIVLHHIIDPATGLPAVGPWRTVSAAAGDCLDANIAATAAIVRGDSALDWLRAKAVPARLVDHAGNVTRVGGWPQ